MKRKIYDQLLLWKNKRKGKSAMMIEGARRVGKSYIVKEFAQKEYKSYILIDFFKVGDDIKDLFKNYTLTWHICTGKKYSITGCHTPRSYTSLSILKTTDSLFL